MPGIGMLLLLRGETGGVEECCRCGSAFADNHVHHRLLLLLLLLCGISMMRPAAGEECNHGTAGLILKVREPFPRSSISLLPPLLHREVQLLAAGVLCVDADAGLRAASMAL
ncbi:unnamed protein product, partial [Ectocarpus sp. 4 AP-2014]